MKGNPKRSRYAVFRSSILLRVAESIRVSPAEACSAVDSAVTWPWRAIRPPRSGCALMSASFLSRGAVATISCMLFKSVSALSQGRPIAARSAIHGERSKMAPTRSANSSAGNAFNSARLQVLLVIADILCSSSCADLAPLSSPLMLAACRTRHRSLMLTGKSRENDRT